MWILTSTLAAAASPSHAQIDAAVWEPLTTVRHADAGQVEVSRSSVAGVQCFQGIARVGSLSPAELMDVILDFDSVERWSSAGVSDSRVLAHTPGKIEYYQYLDIPGWTMASDRFWFLSASIERAEGLQDFRWSPLSDGGAHRSLYEQVKQRHPSAVEPPINVGGWRFASVGDKTEITYQICTHPGGSIPPMVQNAATRKTLPDSIGDLVRETRRRSE